MADTMLLQVVSPERMLVDEQVTEAQIPALDGYIGALPGHAPLLSSLKPGGVLSYKSGGKDQLVAIYGGFVQILPDRVRVLADSARPGVEIDLVAARERLKKAEELMARMQHAEAVDLAGVLAEAMQAQADVDAASAK
jgi:F-type H+-transporting ATPase subunit epsilon